MPNITPGRIGDSAPFVPVRDASGSRLSVDVIRAFVLVAIEYARQRPDRIFHVQQDGWGVPFRDVVPMFKGCTGNVYFPQGYRW